MEALPKSLNGNAWATLSNSREPPLVQCQWRLLHEAPCFNPAPLAACPHPAVCGTAEAALKCTVVPPNTTVPAAGVGEPVQQTCMHGLPAYLCLAGFNARSCPPAGRILVRMLLHDCIFPAERGSSMPSSREGTRILLGPSAITFRRPPPPPLMQPAGPASPPGLPTRRA